MRQNKLPTTWETIELQDVVEVRDFEREPINASERDRRISGIAPERLFPYYGATGQVGWIDDFRTDGERVLLGEDGAPFFDPNRDKAYLVGGKYWVNNHAHVLTGRNGILDNRFLCHQLNTVDFHPFVSGSTRLKLTSAAMKRIPLVLPPLAEQTRIVAKLEELLSDLDAGVAELKAAQAKLAQYRQSLLKAAVEGALTADWRARRAALETDRPVQPGDAENRPRPAEFHASFAAGQRRRHETPPTGGCAVHEDSADGSQTGAQLLARILTERRARWEARQLARFESQGKTPPKGWQSKYPEPVAPDTRDLPELPEGWVWASIEQVSSGEDYCLAIGPFGSNLKVEDYRERGVPLVFVRNIRSGVYGGPRTNYVTREKAKELRAHCVEPGDVLVTKMGEPPGDADVYPADQPLAIITADCIKVRCNTSFVRPAFLKVAINSSIGKQQIRPMTKGVAQKKVSLGRFAKLAVPVPPIQEQDLMIHTLASAERVSQALDGEVVRGLRQSAAQRQNLLKAAFSGQLVPQDQNDEPASVLLERIRMERSVRARGVRSRSRRKETA